MPAETLQQPGRLREQTDVRRSDETAVSDPAWPSRLARVVAVVPCHNRRDDVAAILADLAACSRTWSKGIIDLRVVLVDNASATPLADVPTPRGLPVRHIRNETNTGGSGGFNLGLNAALSLDLDFIWLVDSDARLEPDTLSSLLSAIEARPKLIAVGPAIADPATGQVFELGGRVNRRTGVLEPAVAGATGVRILVLCDYLASCCALVRANAARAAGPFPDRFLNADDVEWFIRMSQRTRGQIAAVPWSRAWHPRFSRFPTWTRYYTTRNALSPLAALGCGRRVRFRRAIADAARAAHQTLLGRRDLARLHLKGLQDLAEGRTTGSADDGVLTWERSRPLDELPAELRDAALLVQRAGSRPLPPTTLRDFSTLIARTFMPRRREAAAVIPARGTLRDLFRARDQVLIDDQGWVERSPKPVRDVLAALAAFSRGALLALKASGVHLQGPSTPDIPAIASDINSHELARALSLDVIVLSYKRPDALLRTLDTLHRDPFIDAGLNARNFTITVIDNASNDGILDRVRSRFPEIRALQLEENLGVEAFNRAVSSSRADVVLILDDDAAPAPGALAIALQTLRDQPHLSAFTLHPRHPTTGESEWPFGTSPSDRWPVMGCANLIRRSAWEAVAGYEPSFFLYRNDMDLALKLLDSGHGIGFDPDLIAWHDTPAGPGDMKSPRWHELATRNWIWMARRHARGVALPVGVFAGWIWAHRAAKFDPARHRATLNGFFAGLMTPPPAWTSDASPAPEPRGSSWRAYIRLRLLGR